VKIGSRGGLKKEGPHGTEPQNWGKLRNCPSTAGKKSPNQSYTEGGTSPKPPLRDTGNLVVSEASLLTACSSITEGRERKL